MDGDLERVYNLVTDAVRSEDVFGDLIDHGRQRGPEEVLSERFAALAAVADPSLYGGSPDDAELAHEARELLLRHRARAQEKLVAGMYGSRAPVLPKRSVMPVLRTERRSYCIGLPCAQGTIATVYEGACVLGEEVAGRVAIKIVDDPRDNELLLREMRTLRYLHAEGGAQRKHLPVLLDQFMTDDGRQGVIFRYLDECLDLLAVRERPQYRDGIPVRHAAWVLNRALSAIGYAHARGVLHGNIEPAHVFLRPRDHNLYLVDWSWSVVKPSETGDRFLIATEDYSAPEVARGEAPTPAADLYAIGKCVIYLLGGDVRNNALPDHVDEPLVRYILHLVRESPLQRADDAWGMWHQLDHLVRTLWGPKKFLDFPV